ncbi:MAG: hypothetical protein A3G80_06015 [Betaproteobacteria bacterium RIFCSPLOWO2_12_FULL_62_13b]|nr:MAG: hypothetical protein A3G80_06015 [Betaproteobacteria bacterium RIFCSPLOWO2_12_FULL_62_13b]
MADLQNLPDARRIPIRKGSVKDMCFALRVRNRTEGAQHTVARFTMTTNPTRERKGVHYIP